MTTLVLERSQRNISKIFEKKKIMYYSKVKELLKMDMKLYKKQTSSPSYHKPLRSPGLSTNQDLKDVALDMVFGRKIKELRSQFIFQEYFRLSTGFDNEF